MNDYRASHLSPIHAEQYAQSFSDNASYRGMVWALEKDVLTKAITNIPWSAPVRHLDFACGTGRVLSYLSSYVAHSTGVDVSASMLKYARASTTGAEILEADLTEDNILSGRQFDLITAFRFFPNAEPELRRQVMCALSDLLTSDGYFIFNNHRNIESARYRLSRIASRGGREGMSAAEAHALAREAGLEITDVCHLGVLPVSEQHPLLPVPLVLPMEKMLSRIRVFKGLAQEHIFLCRKR